MSAVPYVIGGAVLLVAILIVVLFKAMWRVAEPNQALIVSGRRQRGGRDGLEFRIVTGGGNFVIPGVQVVRRLSLDLNASELDVECVTRQGIPLHVKGVVIFKVGDARPSPTPRAGSSTSSTRWAPGSTTSSPATCAPSSAA